jgi:hypothetical protein
MKAKAGGAKKGSTLWWVGLWATVWWGVSGLYILLLVWLAKEQYVAVVEAKSSLGESSLWSLAIKEAYFEYPALSIILILILAVWIVIGIHWLKALKKARISYKEGLKDLFFTIR